MAQDKTLIDRAIWHLIAHEPKEPFLGTLIQQMQITCSTAIPTAGVGFNVENETLELIINLDWFGTLSDAERKAILLHEVKHVLDGHLVRVHEFADRQVHNQACDMAINCYVPNLPKGALYPSLIQEDEYKTSDYYYDAIVKQQQENKDKPKDKGQGKGECKGPQQDDNQGQPSTGQDDAAGQEPQDGQGQGQGQPSPGNGQQAGQGQGSHEMWDTAKDAQRLGQALEVALKRAMDKCKDYGKHEGQLKETLKLIDGVKKLNWTNLLRKFCSRYIPAGDYVNTRSRTNRRYGLQEPGHRLGNGKRLAIGIDVSGSMTEAEINKILGQIKPLMQAGTEGVVFYFDTQVRVMDKLKRRSEYKAIGGGGTDFKDVFNQAKRMKFDGIVMFTDGYDGNSLDCNQKIPTLWVISKEGKCGYDWGWQFQMTE